ncbi:MAG: hypothetical protein AAF597_00535 [Bacteroidota bacterium]
MRIVQVIAILFLLLQATKANAQGRTVGTMAIPPKLFTLRNARVTPGINFSFYTNDNPDPQQTLFKSSTGNLPSNFDFAYGQGDTLHYLAAGLMLDISSPNSVLGFVIGAEYNLNRFGLREKTADTLNSFQIQTLRFPVYLKIKIGDIHNRLNGILMGGVQYALPLSYQRRLRTGRTIGSTNELANGLYYSAIAGVQIRTSRGGTTERTRFWLYARGDLAASNQFSLAGQRAIFGPGVSPSVSYQDLNVSIGLAFFLGSGG